MPEPWETPEGRACIDRWVTDSMSRLNRYQGNAQFNSRKPWSINKYGVLEGHHPGGPVSNGAPDLESIGLATESVKLGRFTRLVIAVKSLSGSNVSLA